MVTRHPIHRSICLAMLVLLNTTAQIRAATLSAFSQNDPFPVYTTLDPYYFLYRQQEERLKGLPGYDIAERVNLSLSPFGQNADKARNSICDSTPVPSCTQPGGSMATKNIEIGDLDGPWDMIATLYGPIPAGKTLAPALQTALTNLFGVPAGTLDDPSAIDPNQQFGFFRIPVQYRKRGLRIELDARPLQDFGLSVKVGIADICQVPLFVNLTDASTVPTTSYPNLTKTNVNNYLMKEVFTIAEELGLDVEIFHEVSVEDLRFDLWWRHAFLINEERGGWPQFLLMPFFLIEGSVAASSKGTNPRDVWGVSFGNNGHDSVGGLFGLNFDFTNSIELGAEIGAVHFFNRKISNFRVPTSEFQSGFYPFATDVCYAPGMNWHFGAKIAAYHFLERLSFYFQYVMVKHDQDCITLIVPDPAFQPEELRDMSSWMAKVANVGFNYDLSPNISLGFLWQTPLKEHNAYRSTTIMFSFNAVY